MRTETLSPAWNLGAESQVVQREVAIPHDRVVSAGWNTDRFAEEQVRGLARQIFSAALRPAVRQVIFCAVDAETDVQSLCGWVGEIVAEERLCEVALVDEREVDTDWALHGGQPQDQKGSVRQFGTRIRRNLWLLQARRGVSGEWMGSLSAYLNEVRKEFEYSIVAAPAAALSSKALEMAAMADGAVLVLSARRTRRVMALKVRGALSHVRLLGTVLCDREFPMPTSIYRRL